MRLVVELFRVSLLRELAQPVNFMISGFFSLAQIVVSWLSLTLVFGQVEALAGWRFSETLLLLGSFHLVSGLMNTFVEPSLREFPQRLLKGELDELLLQPASTLVLSCLGSPAPLNLVGSLLGLVLLVVGAWQSPGLGLGNLLSFLVLVSAGLVASFSVRAILAAFAFWAPGGEPQQLYYAFWQLGRYPVTIYPSWLRTLLTVAVPAALVATLPAEALLGRGSITAAVVGGAAALAALGVALLLWRLGLARYTSATS